MKKVTGLTGTIGLVTALGVGCGTQQRTVDGKVDERAENQALLGEATQGVQFKAQAAAPKAQAAAPKAQAAAPKAQAAAPKAQAAAPKAQAAAPKAQAAAPKAQAAEPKIKAAEPQAQAQVQAGKPIMKEPSVQQKTQQQAPLPAQKGTWQQGKTGTQGEISQMPSTAGGDTGLDQGGVDQPSARSDTHVAADAQIKEWFAADGREGVLLHIDDHLKVCEKNLEAMSIEEAAPFKSMLEEKRSAWSALKDVSEENIFLEQATNLLSDLEDIHSSMEHDAAMAPGT